MSKVRNFTVIDSIHGPFVVNRHCFYQAEYLIKTGATHIEDELANIFYLIDKLPEGAVIIDGGVNIGFFSIPVAQRVAARGGRVIGFEPQKLIYYAAAGSVALNDIDNCYLYNMGLSDKSGAASVPSVDYAMEADYGMVEITDMGGDTPKNFLDDKTVRTIAIDELDLPRIDFIKLDVEGHEVRAIRGGLASIAKFRPILWVEYFLIGQEVIKACFAEVPGYVFRTMDAQNMLCAPAKRLEEMGITL
jgi:FkbM family methyltransferase